VLVPARRASRADDLPGGPAVQPAAAAGGQPAVRCSAAVSCRARAPRALERDAVDRDGGAAGASSSAVIGVAGSFDALAAAALGTYYQMRIPAEPTAGSRERKVGVPSRSKEVVPRGLRTGAGSGHAR
jgi:hypothetical protein